MPWIIGCIVVGMLVGLLIPLPSPHQIVVVQPCRVYSQTYSVTVVGP